MAILENCILNTSRFLFICLGAVFIISGVALKNGYAKQNINKLKQNVKTISSKSFEGIGTTMFIIGWIIVAYGLIAKNLENIFDFSENYDIMKSSVVIASIAMIWIAVFVTMSYRDKQKVASTWTGYVFIGGWLMLGISSIMSRDGQMLGWSKLLCGLVSAGLVILSMAYILPKERKNKITDGFGMPAFTAGFGALALCASCN